jgi:ABC-type Fe3+-hydroxamate transport system substrate-binding protein
MTKKERIAELERKVAELEQRLAAVESRPVVYIPSTGTATDPWPTPKPGTTPWNPLYPTITWCASQR